MDDSGNRLFFYTFLHRSGYLIQTGGAAQNCSVPGSCGIAFAAFSWNCICINCVYTESHGSSPLWIRSVLVMESRSTGQPWDAKREPAEYDFIVSGRAASAICISQENVLVEGTFDRSYNIGNDWDMPACILPRVVWVGWYDTQWVRLHGGVYIEQRAYEMYRLIKIKILLCNIDDRKGYFWWTIHQNISV